MSSWKHGPTLTPAPADEQQIAVEPGIEEAALESTQRDLQAGEEGRWGSGGELVEVLGG